MWQNNIRNILQMDEYSQFMQLLKLYRFLQNWLQVFTHMSGELWKLQEWMGKFYCRFLFFRVSPTSRINRNLICFEGDFIWHPPELPFVSLQSGAISIEVWIWMLSVSLLVTALQFQVFRVCSFVVGTETQIRRLFGWGSVHWNARWLWNGCISQSICWQLQQRFWLIWHIRQLFLIYYVGKVEVRNEWWLWH